MAYRGQKASLLLHAAAESTRASPPGETGAVNTAFCLQAINLLTPSCCVWSCSNNSLELGRVSQREQGNEWSRAGDLTGPTRVQSRCRRPPYPVPSNRSPPSAAPTDTAPRHTIRKAPAPRMSTSPPKKTSRSAAHRASGGVVRRVTGRLLPQPQDVPSGLTTNTEINDVTAVERGGGGGGGGERRRREEEEEEEEEEDDAPINPAVCRSPPSLLQSNISIEHVMGSGSSGRRPEEPGSAEEWEISAEATRAIIYLSTSLFPLSTTKIPYAIRYERRPCFPSGIDGVHLITSPLILSRLVGFTRRFEAEKKVHL
ncbi:unnamed protein product [Pleuronectes platessa]|uniref:Uncharacterized protein n=1 Tax=Pleuronectes platessa TaxID=8262 RepID=A0A9N7TM30_PLEPL|nr:unnamed protein product [Pleuronectes platessa]